MDNIKKIFIIFVFVSLLFLSMGVLAGYNLADIEWSRNQLISDNPQNVDFSMHYNSTYYIPEISFTIKNEGRFDFNLEKITWVVYLVNGTKMYQANNYAWTYKRGAMVVPCGGSKKIHIVDNSSTHMWMHYVLNQLKWIVEHYGKNNVTWRITLDVDGTLGNFNGEQYEYNLRTWYLWKLPEVSIEYEGNQTAS